MNAFLRASLVPASLFVLAGSVAAQPQPSIAPSQAAAHVGACMTVEGHASMMQDESRPGIDINLDGDSGFMAYVPYPGGFPGLKDFDGQNVAITGIVLIDRGRPSIQLNNPEMIMAAGTDPGKLITCDND